MRKIVVILSTILLGFTSCINSGLEELPVYNEADITAFNLEYRFVTKNANGLEMMAVVTLNNADLKIDNKADIVTLSASVPAPTSTFSAAERKKVTLQSIVAYTKLSPAARIEPIDGAPVLGVPGDFSGERKYKVTAADGKTVKTWTIKVNPLPVISQYEGTYTESGTLVRGDGAPEQLNAEIYVSTVDATTVMAQAGKSIFDNPAILYRIKVNADNTVTISSEPTASVTIIPQTGVASTYNPSTKTFDLHYEYTTSARRKFDTKLVLKN